ncbi:hypothetical protein [Lacinutrix sp. Bg11-31]|uniref:hypothetical protein n=1 Tax=Lacinutrix sp. Bg11-31 TaxID=2057808 RepID=UPI000C31A734|nr:hypothetical protein [Lacinutrix sp. Bg11-31]AUC83599.1 hypothetical protein CW733_16275 [Lacinutrix sp. Bg11-31]
MKDFKLYILNAVLIFIVGYHILPDFSLKKSDFNKVSGILSSAKIENKDDGRSRDYGFKNAARKRLILNLSDRQLHEYYVSDIYKNHWETLLNPNAIGQDLVLYLGVGEQQEDPFRIELNNAVVYDTDVRFYRNLLIMLFTLALTIRNLFFYFKTENDVDFTTDLKAEHHSFATFLKRKAIGLRDYFLK